eukprot:CAMPEP_0117692182 /NCGR_PEP_ID=MMETSP0804-20121206/26175_1 /TAXON_ID=1074897 /ORGANISM="Tetraselmis astigmatica, Strain CCMP880" /LENGTH=41 /DNA_ID= /DNA_START= /DNA_END= /DNA_ORIENTATION=
MPTSRRAMLAAGGKLAAEGKEMLGQEAGLEEDLEASQSNAT